MSCMTEVCYFVVLVNRDGARPDPKRVRPILEYPVPKNFTRLRIFPGLASKYRNFFFL